MPRVFIKTYGCQMNVRDSEQVARQFQDRGYELTEREEEADVILLNTCSVRDQAESKAISNMGRLSALKRARSGVVLGFMGCMAQSRGEELLKKLPDVDLVVGVWRFHHVAAHVDGLLSADGRRPRVADLAEEEGSERMIRDHVAGGPRASAFVSVMQGCNMRCAFCIVPSVRGPERSRSISEIVAEARALVASGVREIVLLGQIVNAYGRREFPREGGRSPFVQLLEALHEIEGLERLRFTAPHPTGFRDDLIGAFGRLPKLCEHVHLPAQSGADRVLRAMKRSYTVDHYRRLVEKLRARVPGLALSTDLIVAFPGETDREFQETVRFAREMAFDQAFVFRYSPRKGTPAAAMPGQHDEDEKRRRNQELLAVVNEGMLRRLDAEAGHVRETLVEGPSAKNPARLTGRTRQNRIVVWPADGSPPGTLRHLRIEKRLGFSLLGTPLPDE
ncbi:MAG: tRNA (N6-isopentenyl adenosine(37)-C2)-methylthiotransferase MiaB [Verrucomicrobiae bacterium]|nr:tRNA (N6-isopentenyl adenosine(37)-C2)-methylthiotransferase MiaB [Verrucomicrobiae bacterium]